MKARVLFFIRYFLFWFLLFWIYKAIFLIYHHSIYAQYTLSEFLKVFLYGSKLDISFTSYIAVIPLFIIAVSAFFRFGIFQKIIRIYTFIIIPLMTLITFTDLEIFQWWGFRIDSTLFKYMNTPKEVIASIWMSPVFLLTVLFIVSSLIFAYVYLKIVESKKDIAKAGFWTFIVPLLFVPVLFIFIRGGIQLAPINQSAVYFSNDQFLNQAAVNAPWNLAYSILEKNYNEENPFLYQSIEEAERRVSQLYPPSQKPFTQVVNNKKNLNVILIIWESFTAKSVETLGGKKGITPAFEKLIHEGVFFNNIYASGDRSDKGLIAVLSSFPAQPTTSIMNKTNKAAKLPSLSKTFKTQNYNTSFYYGGEPEFANIKSYLLNSQYEKIIGKSDFPANTWNSKWGAHDEVVLNRLTEDLNKSKQPFFATVFTLSSHEPFEVPMAPLLPGKDEESLFLNSLHYTDWCIGQFIEKAKKSSWWDNTVIIITADHGHPLPSMNGIHAVTHYPSEFHVPMLWLGGALSKKDTIITTLGSQTDLSTSLFKQLNMPASEFVFSKNLLESNPVPFSYYAFRNGFGYLTPNGHFVFDNISKNFLDKTQGVTEEDLLNGKAYLQFSFQQYLNK